jgi:hypothetical protein
LLFNQNRLFLLVFIPLCSEIGNAGLSKVLPAFPCLISERNQ